MKFKKPKREITEWFLHHSATDKPGHDDIGWVRNLHVNQNGWDDVSYHYFINSKGELQIGRDLEKIPAAQAGHNTNTGAICLSGVGSSFTLAQFKTLEKLCNKINKAYKGEVKFKGHKEVYATECPHYDYKALLGISKEGFMHLLPPWWELSQYLKTLGL